MKKILTIASILLFITAARASADDIFRCGTDVVNLGDSTVKVLLSCGPPSYKEPINPGIEGPRVENWFYNCGSSGFLYLLRFEDGTLQSIGNEGYGSGRSDCTGAENR